MMVMTTINQFSTRTECCVAATQFVPKIKIGHDGSDIIFAKSKKIHVMMMLLLLNRCIADRCNVFCHFVAPLLPPPSGSTQRPNEV